MRRRLGTAPSHAPVRCVVLSGVVFCVVVVCAPPSWWDVLHWRTVCCVMWCCVLWWCVPP